MWDASVLGFVLLCLSIIIRNLRYVFIHLWSILKSFVYVCVWCCLLTLVLICLLNASWYQNLSLVCVVYMYVYAYIDFFGHSLPYGLRQGLPAKPKALL